MSNATKSEIVVVASEEVAEVSYNLIEIRNKITNARFYAVRKETIEAYWKRVVRDAKNPNYPTALAGSVREHGEENFSKKVLGTYATRREANADRFAMTVKNGLSLNGTLNMNLPRDGVPEALEEVFNKVPKQFRTFETTNEVVIHRHVD